MTPRTLLYHVTLWATLSSLSGHTKRATSEGVCTMTYRRGPVGHVQFDLAGKPVMTFNVPRSEDVVRAMYASTVKGCVSVKAKEP